MAEMVDEKLEVNGMPVPDRVPVIPIQGDVPFPLAVSSLVFRRPYSLSVLEILEKGQPYFLAVWSGASPDPRRLREQMPGIGVVCRLLSSRDLGPGRHRVDFEGLYRAGTHLPSDDEGIITVGASRISETVDDETKVRSQISVCYDLLLTIVERSEQYSIELVREAEVARNDPPRFADFIGASIHFSQEDKWRLIQLSDPLERLSLLGELLRSEVGVTDRKADLEHRTREALEKRERVEFLRMQLQALRKELEILEPGANELDQLADQLGHAGLPAVVARRARNELERLRLISTASSEYSEIRNYLDWLIHIPWTATAHERTAIGEIRRVLDDEFYGQARAKDKICEYLSVGYQTGRPAPNVLCLVGPSGIGKTKLARAVARALRRPQITLNLGLLRSEGVFRGNRRTFPGAMPGRLLRQLRTVEVVNPVCVFEDVDRLGGEVDRPDLSAIVMESMDPTYNSEFRDHYLEFPYDLSRIFFICTATDPEDIPEMLADRMEFIELPGYIFENKIEITFKHLWPQQLAEHGLLPEEYSLTVAAVQRIIREYTLEAGLSNLNKNLEVICRHLAMQRAEGHRGFVRLGVQQIEKILGTPIYIPEKAEAKPEIGVAMGVAWTQTGGDIMLIEALKMRGSGMVISTGSLGEVMRESIQAAHSWVRSRADWLGIAHEDFGNYDIHVHFPSGAIPKDGPSAGVTVTLVIASVLSERPIRNDVAMTGEVSLRGKILPVGGIKEKVAAAHRVGIYRIIVPKQNIKDLQDVPRRISKEMTYIPVDTVDEVFPHILLDFDPARASLEKLLRMEIAKSHTKKRTRPKSPAGKRGRSQKAKKTGE